MICLCILRVACPVVGRGCASSLQWRFMRQRSAVRDILEYTLALSVIASLEWTPLPVANRLARGYARLLDRALPRLRRVAMSNLAMAMSELSLAEHSRITDGVFRSIARLLVVFARFPRI